MSIQTKIPVAMRRAITQYTDIRDELEEFLGFIQDICSDIGDVVSEVDDQLDYLCDRLATYNEIAENYVFLKDTLFPTQSAAESDLSAEEEWPFPDPYSKKTV